MDTKMKMGMEINMEMELRMRMKMMMLMCCVCAPHQPPRGLMRRTSRRSSRRSNASGGQPAVHAVRIVMEQTGCNERKAARCLTEAQNNLGTAILIAIGD